jgi:hypothetical protein
MTLGSDVCAREQSPRTDNHFEVPRQIVFKQILVEGGSGNQGVEFIRPRPRFPFTGFYPHGRAPLPRSDGDDSFRHFTRIRDGGKRKLPY